MRGNSDLRARHRAVIATLLALLIAFAAASGAQAKAAVPRTFFGVMPQTSLSTADIQHMGQARVGTLRMGFDWSYIDPTPEGTYNFGLYDELVKAAAENGITVLPFTRPGLSRSRGSPSSGAPTRSSNGTR